MKNPAHIPHFQGKGILLPQPDVYKRQMIVHDGRLVFEYPEYLDSRSQDLEPHYHDVGQFYVFFTEAFQRNKKLMTGDILPYVVDEMEVQDIDNQTDWEIAEIKFRRVSN